MDIASLARPPPSQAVPWSAQRWVLPSLRCAWLVQLNVPNTAGQHVGMGTAIQPFDQDPTVEEFVLTWPIQVQRDPEARLIENIQFLHETDGLHIIVKGCIGYAVVSFLNRV